MSAFGLHCSWQRRRLNLPDALQGLFSGEGTEEDFSLMTGMLGSESIKSCKLAAAGMLLLNGQATTRRQPLDNGRGTLAVRSTRPATSDYRSCCYSTQPNHPQPWPACREGRSQDQEAAREAGEAADGGVQGAPGEPERGGWFDTRWRLLQ